MIGMFFGYKVFVEPKVTFRVGHRALFVTPAEALDLMSNNYEKQARILKEIEAYELSRQVAA